MLVFFPFSFFFLRICCCYTLLGLPYWWGFQDAELAHVLSQLLHKRKLPQLLTLKFSCILSLREPVIALYVVFWMIWEHSDMAYVMLGIMTAASFLTVFFDH